MFRSKPAAGSLNGHASARAGLGTTLSVGRVRSSWRRKGIPPGAGDRIEADRCSVIFDSPARKERMEYLGLTALPARPCDTTVN